MLLPLFLLQQNFSLLFQEVKLTDFAYSKKGMLTCVFSMLEYQKDVWLWQDCIRQLSSQFQGIC